MYMEVSTFEQLGPRMLEDARHTGRPGIMLPFQMLWPATAARTLIHGVGRPGKPQTVFGNPRPRYQRRQ